MVTVPEIPIPPPQNLNSLEPLYNSVTIYWVDPQVDFEKCIVERSVDNINFSVVQEVNKGI